MRQYGALAGNPWESDSNILAAKARNIEDREAEKCIEAGVEDWEYRTRSCGVHGCPECGG